MLRVLFAVLAIGISMATFAGTTHTYGDTLIDEIRYEHPFAPSAPISDGAQLNDPVSVN